MLIEIVTFRLAAGADEAAFLAADQRVQTEFYCLQPGFMRRTTARGSDGEWLVVLLWDSESEAEAALSASSGHPAVPAFMSLIDVSTFLAKRYTALD